MAPDWILKDLENRTVALSELNSKVILIQFTGVGCGPCHASIPFLKQLVGDYKEKDFELVAIETWSKNEQGLRRYHDLNNITFKFLKGNEQIITNYEVGLVPAFFILNQKKIVTKVIFGYSRESTGKEIIDTINGLL